MATKKISKYSSKEIIDLASKFISGILNPEAMGLTVDELDIEQFQNHFKETAKEMLKNQNSLSLRIGLFGSTNSSDVYSDDMRAILNVIEEKMQMQFYFKVDALLYFGKDFIYANF